MIADLAVNHVERHVLLCGHTVERHFKDYGFDLSLFTYDSNGERQNDVIYLQVKATDHLKLTLDRRDISFRLNMKDVNHWKEEQMPVIVIVYDAIRERAYWLNVRDFLAQPKKPINERKKSVVVSIPVKNMVNKNAIERFARFRDEIRDKWSMKGDTHGA